jgi:uncharacterized protein (TIGR00369 family)
MPRLALERLHQMLTGGRVPHHVALGLRAVAAEESHVVVGLPYATHLVGNPETGVLHGGAITALLDCVSAMAVWHRQVAQTRIATIDLRIDYARLPVPGREVLAHAECYQLSRLVAFTRAVAYHDSPLDPVAAAAATFMIFHDERSASEPAA